MHVRMVGTWLVALGMVTAVVTAGDLPVVEVGFSGYFKQDAWSPVSISSFPGASLTAVTLLDSHYRHGGMALRVIGRYGAVPDVSTGGWRALIRTPRNAREPLLRCTFTLADGQEQVVDTPLAGLETGDTLALVVTATPDDFQFMGALEHGRRRVTRSVAGGPGLLRGADWRTLQGVSLVILDGPDPVDAESAQALRDWVIQGGTAILTDRAWEGDNAAWGLMPEVAGIPYQESGGEVLRAILDAHDAVLSFRRRAVVPDSETFASALVDEAGLLIGTRDKGQGRIVALTLDWRSMTLRDRALYDPVRRDIWTAFLELSRESQTSAYGASRVVVPREAQVKTLMWPILGFLLVCALLLGPVNRLVLARLKRVEYTVVTLPVGAFLLSLAALLAGLVWRPDYVLVKEIMATVADGDGATWSHGVAGVLAPRTDVYSVSVDRLTPLLSESPRPARHGSQRDAGDAESVLVHGPASARIASLDIARWSMRFFNTRVVPMQPPVLEAWARPAGARRLEGVIANRSGQDVEHIHVVFRDVRVAVGALAAGEEIPFAFDFDADDEARGDRCPNCGGYHGAHDPFAPRKGEPPLPLALESMGRQVLGWAGGGRPAPVVIGLERDPAPLLNVMPAVPALERRTAHIVAVPVAMRWAAPLYVPDGFAYRIALPNPDPDRHVHDRVDPWSQHLSRAPAAYHPHVMALRDGFRLSPMLRGDAGPGGEAWDAMRIMRAEAYILPVIEPSSRVEIAWELPLPEDDDATESTESAPEAVLESFHWGEGDWRELARAGSGLQRVAVAGDSGFLMDDWPVLVLRQRGLTPDIPATHAAFAQYPPRSRYWGLRRATIQLTVQPEGAGHEH